MGTQEMSGFHYRLRKILHRLKAKGRHGTHSPFVYQFVERVLQAKGRQNGTVSLDNSLPKNFGHLLPGIVSFLAVEKVLGCDHGGKAIARQLVAKMPQGQHNGSMYLISALPSSLTLADVPFRKLSENDCVLVLKPYRTKAASLTWAGLVSCSNANMVLDTFDLGLLLYRKDFKTKQYFRLRSWG
ncbi:MAG: hypothetical protein QM642_04580 [Edaphocola sp.]